MKTINQKYEEAINTPSDINQHIIVLKEYANRCEHVTEMGVRQCVSTWAFLQSKAKTVIGYDIAKQPQVDECIKICNEQNRKWKFIEADVLKVEIEQTDFLFIDTFHTQTQLNLELRMHSDKVKKYIGFHDTTSFEFHGEQPENSLVASNQTNCGKGIWYAIEEFLLTHPEWVIDYRVTFNNGLTILRKRA